jgi:ABC-type nitrate/sulfonate/bicarbonate transport system substrate-binding protein
MSNKVAFALLLAAGSVLGLQAGAFAQTEIKISTFSGSTNVVTWAAIEKGFFEKEGLKATAERTHGSKEQQEDLMAGKYQFASTSFDNVVAYTEGEGQTKFPDYDVVAIMGVHQGMTNVVARPEIKTYQDIKGQTVAVDSPTSGYATVLYQIIKDKTGMVQEKDYKLAAVGGTRARVKALEDKTAVAAIISTPSDMELVEKGFNRLGDVAEELGAYQGSAFIVRKSYAQANPKVVEAFARAIVAASDFVFSDKAGAIAVLKNNLKGLDDAEASKIYDRLIGPGGLNKRAELSTKGVENVLKLRSVYGDSKGPTADAKKYIDLSYHEKATAKK